ncbi:A-kinase anchor protein 12 isoform X1 [Saimiri boliviensis]|uniref:A-kinase anchor protein 12 isoform X1 n=1 Tax=Saimiri boliviensis TaxID=27679 RepID=UPI003D76A7DE
MGAGSSTEQRSPEQPPEGSSTPAEPETSGGGPSAEAVPDTTGDSAIAAADSATKLLQKNGQLSTINGLAEQDELSLQEGALKSQEGGQEGALNGQEEEVIATDVGQRDSEDVSERDSDKEMAAKSTVDQDVTDVGQEETPEIIEQIPSSESNLEELAQPAESQANDIGFKKVFKFVGFKFTVKKDKTEKPDTVQLLTVKKDEGEGAAGAGDHQDPSPGAGEAASKDSELKQSTEKPEETLKHEQSHAEISPPAEAGQAVEECKEEGEEKQEKEPSKSAESPASPVTTETASTFKKFFTQGWAGWRKKTSFRKPKEEELEASEKKKEQEPEKDTEENGKAEAPSEQAQPQEGAESAPEPRLSAEYEKVELPPEEEASGSQGPSEEKPAPLATEVFDEKIEVHQEEVVADVHVSTAEERTEEPKTEVEETAGSVPAEELVEMNAEPQEAEPAKELVTLQDTRVSGEDPAQGADLSPDEKAPSKPPEGFASEVELLSSQERMKVQGSPLKKLFTSTGLKKLSGKKQKGKRGGVDEDSGEHTQVPADSPDSHEEQKGESSASSPEEPEEITCLEKGLAEVHQDGETEEGATSDGEKKREGVTPWASFKKMVTPKKRVRRPSESDKEDELDKVKSATLSSTESAASEMQEEMKGSVDEQKPEEPKRKVDTSVSWEALICVGSSKKRARKGSSSDEEGGPKTMGGDHQKADEPGKDKETGTDGTLTGSQEHEPGQGCSSPEQAGSPTEGEGVSTWESFKRLVTPRKKSKSKLEEKNEDSVAGSGVEHATPDAEPGKEESWVSIKKFIPGRRKKRPDGKQEQVPAEDAGPAGANEDDSDVPAVVPLSEYDAVEREKMEAQQAQKIAEQPEHQAAAEVSKELSDSQGHMVAAAVIDGTRAAAINEERSPSWISALVTEPLEQVEPEATPLTGEVLEREVIAEEETPEVTEPLPENREAQGDTVVSEVELTSKAATAAKTAGPLGAEEGAEASAAEETTEMVSAVSQLTDSPDTTEEATPVQEVEGGVPDMEEQERRTQEVLQAVAEKVKEESQLPGTSGPEDMLQPGQRAEAETSEEEAEALDLKKETDVVLKVDAQEVKTEAFTQGKTMRQTTPESFEKAPPATESGESSELATTCHAETLAGGKSQEMVVEQPVPADLAETPTDSETDGSTPVADFDTLGTTQRDKIVEIQEENQVASGTRSGGAEAEAVPAQTEGPPAPSSFVLQEETKEKSKMEDTLEHTDKEGSVEAGLVLSKTEGTQEPGQFADKKTKDEPFVKGLDTGIGVSQEKVTKVALTEEVTGEAECQKDDATELQSHTKSALSTMEREMVVQVERGKMEAEPTRVKKEKLEHKTAVTISEEVSKQLVQTVSVPIIDGAKEVRSLEGSPPHCLGQEEAACTKIQGQSSEASLTLTAAAEEEKVLGETVSILETGETLEPAGAHSVLEEKSSEKNADLTAHPGEDTVPTAPKGQAKSIPGIGSATTEEGLRSDLDGERTTSLKWKSDEADERVACPEGRVRVAIVEDSEPEHGILELETESSKLVQNIIQTAVDQFVRTEETATEMFESELQRQAHLIKADKQDAGQVTEKGSEPQASAQDEPQTLIAKEESEPTAVGQTHSDTSKDTSEASEKTMTVEVEGSTVNDQQLEAVILPSDKEGDGAGTKSVPEDEGHALLAERIEKSRVKPKDDEKGDDVDPENQNSALADTDASGGLTKESPDTNGPKQKEKEDAQEVEFQEGKVHSESDKAITTETQEEMQEQRESAKSERAES